MSSTLKSFCIEKTTVYREIKLQDRNIQRIYEIVNPQGDSIIEIPTGCVELRLLKNDSEKKLEWKEGGAVSEAGMLSDWEYCFGVMLKPGTAISPADVSCDELIELFDEGELSLQKAQKICHYLSERIQRAEHVIVDQLIESVLEKKGNTSIKELIDQLGYSQRYSERIFKEGMGFSIKRFAGIVRLQNALEMLNNEVSNDDAIYEQLGYYDQAHFIHEFKKFTSLTPNRFRRRRGEITFV